jgi:uncharacterized metal-binding protein YceD (DUF177 family)
VTPPVSLAAGAPSPWSVPVAVENLPDEGLHREILASDAECAGVVALAAVRAVSGLAAELDVMREGNGVHVSGRVHARVGQNCVVTLEPIETEIDEPIEVSFAPVAEDSNVPDVRKADNDPPEPLINGTIDLGAIATEFLILGIDPYPRKAGVEFTPPAVADDGPHPFAVLAALKKRPSGGNR